MLTFFTITHLQNDEATFSAEITFNAAHPVFAGHFPGKPIVPGVFLLEILTAIIARITHKEVGIETILNIKFLQVIDPETHPVVFIDGSISAEEDGRFRVDAACRNGETIFAKFKSLKCK
jgi:3-hydroxyacyl-[acyl-carrier-protein] dehydratase